MQRLGLLERLKKLNIAIFLLFSSDNCGKSKFGHYTDFCLNVAWVTVCIIARWQQPLPEIEQPIASLEDETSFLRDVPDSREVPDTIPLYGNTVPRHDELKTVDEVNQEDILKIGSTIPGAELKTWQKWKSIVVASHLLFLTNTWELHVDANEFRMYKDELREEDIDDEEIEILLDDDTVNPPVTIEYIARMIARKQGIGKILPDVEPVITGGYCSNSDSYIDYMPNVMGPTREMLKPVFEGKNPRVNEEIHTPPSWTTSAPAPTPPALDPTQPGAHIPVPAEGPAPTEGPVSDNSPATVENPRPIMFWGDHQIWLHLHNAQRDLPNYQNQFHCFGGGLHTCFAFLHSGMLKYGDLYVNPIESIVNSNPDLNIKMNKHRKEGFIMKNSAETLMIQFLRHCVNKGDFLRPELDAENNAIKGGMRIEKFEDLLEIISKATDLEIVLAYAERCVKNAWR